MISAIFAADDQGGIGLNNTMPWPTNKEDLQWFKNTTTGHVVVMGKGTWNAEGMPKPLPNRINVVVTNTEIENNEIIQGRGNVCLLLQRLEQEFPDKEIFVIGGANLLVQAKPVLKRIYLTKIPGNYNCTAVVDLAELTKDFVVTETHSLTHGEIEIYEATT